MTFKLRKILSGSFGAAVLTLATIVTVSALILAGTVSAAAGGILGDADGNGKVTISDVTCIQRVLAEFPEDGYSEFAADVDGNGEVEISDATLIQQWLAEMDIPYPVGSQFEEPTETTAEQPTVMPTDEDGWGRIIFQP